MRSVLPVAVIVVFAATFSFLIFGCSPSTEEPSARTLVVGFSNDMIGEIRSCGCAAKDYGGLGRRATYLRQVQDTTRADFLLLEGGDFFSEKLNYGVEKADLTLKSMAFMGYHGVVIGEKDLGFGLDFIRDRARELRVPVLVANMTQNDTLVFPPTRIVTLKSGLRVGLIGVVSPKIDLPPQVDRSTVKIQNPVAAVKRHCAELLPQVDLIAVLGHMSRGEALRLAQGNSNIDLLVHGHEGRPMRKTRRFGNAFVLQIADRGRYMGLAHAVLHDDLSIKHLETNISPLISFYPDAAAIDKLFKAYDLNIAAKEKSNMPAGVFASRNGLDTPFAGAGACEPCHSDIHAQWSGTKHAHAFDILTSQSRGFDRDCTPCHTSGFYERGGFENASVTPELTHVQCESCHGNGHDHMKDPTVKPGGKPSDTCKSCHTVDQTPDFDFTTYWSRIRH